MIDLSRPDALERLQREIERREWVMSWRRFRRDCERTHARRQMAGQWRWLYRK